mgnify:FL=1
MNTYQLATLHDLLAVPVERREACMRDIQSGLLMHELAYGEDAKDVTFGPLSWADDNDHSVQIVDADGTVALELSVAKQEVKP